MTAALSLTLSLLSGSFIIIAAVTYLDEVAAAFELLEVYHSLCCVTVSRLSRRFLSQ